jgi:putative oxidoreductase
MPRTRTVEDLRLLAVRLTLGGLMAGHGAQKLFGWFGGHGLSGVAGWLESLGLRPGIRWALAAGLSEFGGGLLTALGLLNPLGPIGIVSAMIMATVKGHRKLPIWVTEGGPELPVIYGVGALALGLAGPGRYAVDHALGIRVPPALVALAAAAAAAGVALGVMSRPEPTPEVAEQASTEPPGGQGAQEASEGPFE